MGWGCQSRSWNVEYVLNVSDPSSYWPPLDCLLLVLPPAPLSLPPRPSLRLCPHHSYAAPAASEKTVKPMRAYRKFFEPVAGVVLIDT